MIFLPATFLLTGLASLQELPNVYGHSLNLNNQVQSGITGMGKASLRHRMVEIKKREIASAAGKMEGTGEAKVHSSFVIHSDRITGSLDGIGGYKGLAEGAAQANVLGVHLATKGQVLTGGGGTMKAYGQIKGLETGFNADIAHEGCLDANVQAKASMNGLQVGGGSAKLRAGFGQNINVKGGVGMEGLFGAKLTSKSEGRYIAKGGGGVGFGYYGVGGEFLAKGIGNEQSALGVGVGIDKKGLNVFGGGETILKGTAGIQGTGGIGGAEYIKKQYW